MLKQTLTCLIISPRLPSKPELPLVKALIHQWGKWGTRLTFLRTGHPSKIDEKDKGKEAAGIFGKYWSLLECDTLSYSSHVWPVEEGR